MKKSISKTAFVLIIFVVILISFIAKIRKADIDKRPNVILIVVDALRPDHLGCYGYHKNTSPNIDDLADDSTLFKTAVTVFPRTTPSAASLLTGLYPHTHGTRSITAKEYRFISYENLFLSEILQNQGYDTAAFIEHALLNKRSGMEQGFKTFANANESKELFQWSLSWLHNHRKKNKPFFLFLWYLAPHFPYEPPLEDLSLFLSDDDINL